MEANANHEKLLRPLEENIPATDRAQWSLVNLTLFLHKDYIFKYRNRIVYIFCWKHTFLDSILYFDISIDWLLLNFFDGDFVRDFIS